MDERLFAHQAGVYLATYLGAIALVGAWEAVAPRRALSAPLPARWAANVALSVLDAVIIRSLVPVTLIGLALAMEARGWGLLNALAIPAGLAVPVALLALDLGRYVQHALLHRVPALWRCHRAHHTDHDYDLTTALRFHPLDACFSHGFNLLTIVLLGPPVIAVVVFETVLVATSFIVHGNVRLPERLDRWLRLVLVTPDMHRVHHSAAPCETNANYGSICSWWDRLLGTYVAQPAAGHAGMTIGLAGYRDPRHLRLAWILACPFLAGERAPAREAGDPAHGAPATGSR